MPETETYEIDWSEHPKLRELDIFVADTFGKHMQDLYFGTYRKANCVLDVKTSALAWIEDRRQELDDMKELVDKLPDDGLDKQTYEYDESTNEEVE